MAKLERERRLELRGEVKSGIDPLFSCLFILSVPLLQKTQEDTGKGARCAGDGRFDSPGWTAKYCNYFIQVYSFG